MCALATSVAANVLVAPDTIAQNPVVNPQTHGGVYKDPPPAVGAVRLRGAITIDGRLDEEVWKTAQSPQISDSREPYEGKPATQRTEVRFAYDATGI